MEVLSLERDGKFFLKEKNWRKAEEIFSRLLDCGDIFWIYLGKSLVGQRKYKDAKECFETVLPRCDNRIDQTYSLLKELGFCYYHLGDLDASQESFHKALALKKNENDLDLMMGYGLLLTEKKRYTEAKEKFQKILEQNPTHADAWANLAEVRASLGDFELAYYTLQRAFDFEPENKFALKVKVRWTVEFQNISGQKELFFFQH